MKLSREGYLEIAMYEGLVLSPYLDTQGVWTIGLGHTDHDKGLKPSKMKPSEVIAPHQAVSMYMEDMKRYEERVNEYVRVPLTQNQYDALVSFDYNTGGISNSTLTRRVNDGATAKVIADAFMMWTKNKELIGRRTNEKNLFIYGTYKNEGTCTLWRTNGKGRLTKGEVFKLSEYL